MLTCWKAVACYRMKMLLIGTHIIQGALEDLESRVVRSGLGEMMGIFWNSRWLIPRPLTYFRRSNFFQTDCPWRQIIISSISRTKGRMLLECLMKLLLTNVVHFIIIIMGNHCCSDTKRQTLTDFPTNSST